MKYKPHKKKKSKKYAPYRSGLEYRVAQKLSKDFEYEKHRVVYVLNHNYLSDFSNGRLYIETKGFFRPGDTKRYPAITDTLRARGDELVFVFSNPDKPVRKGAKLTMAKWAEKHNIRWFTEDTIGVIL